MLQSLVAYARGAGVDARWSVIDGEPDFFVLTKRIHHKLHGSPGDGGPLGARRARDLRARDPGQRRAPGDRARRRATSSSSTTRRRRAWSPRSRGRDVHRIWRSHIGIDEPNEHVREVWDFLLPYLEEAEAFIFTRREYAPEQLDGRDLTMIPPSIDVFAQKNQAMSQPSRSSRSSRPRASSTREAIVPPTYLHHDGREDHVARKAEMDEDERLTLDDRLIVQVSRWDPLKDPVGVMRGFAEHVAPYVADARLVLAGPSPAGVTDDPEGAVVLEQVRAARLTLEPDVRRRVHLASLPMDDRSENAAIVNAIQRRATIVVQKSLAEGFGLTVAEAMWKDRPVVASGVGGIQDQIVDGESGVLLADPHDLAAYGSAVSALLADPATMDAMGEAARERVRAEFLGSRHLIQYLGLFQRLTEGDGYGDRR